MKISKESTDIERWTFAGTMMLLFMAYAILVSSIMDGAGAFIVWVILCMLTANFYVLVMIRNMLYRQYKLEKEMFEQNGKPSPTKSITFTTPVVVNDEEKPTKKKRK